MRKPIAAVFLAAALMVSNTSVRAVDFGVGHFSARVAEVDTAALQDLVKLFEEFGDVPAGDPIIAAVADYAADILRAAIRLRAHSESLAGLFGGENAATAASGTASRAAIALGRAADAANRLMHLIADYSAVAVTARLFPDLTTADLDSSLIKLAAHGEKFSTLSRQLSHFALELAEGDYIENYPAPGQHRGGAVPVRKTVRTEPAAVRGVAGSKSEIFGSALRTAESGGGVTFDIIPKWNECPREAGRARSWRPWRRA